MFFVKKSVFATLFQMKNCIQFTSMQMNNLFEKNRLLMISIFTADENHSKMLWWLSRGGIIKSYFLDQTVPVHILFSS